MIGPMSMKNQLKCLFQFQLSTFWAFSPTTSNKLNLLTWLKITVKFERHMSGEYGHLVNEKADWTTINLMKPEFIGPII